MLEFKKLDFAEPYLFQRVFERNYHLSVPNSRFYVAVLNFEKTEFLYVYIKLNINVHRRRKL